VVLLLQVILQPHLNHGAFLLDAASKHCLIAELAALLKARSRCLVARLAAAPVLDRTLSAARHLLHDVGPRGCNRWATSAACKTACLMRG
jgi:hypothetical protein